MDKAYCSGLDLDFALYRLAEQSQVLESEVESALVRNKDVTGELASKLDRMRSLAPKLNEISAAGLKEQQDYYGQIKVIYIKTAVAKSSTINIV